MFAIMPTPIFSFGFDASASSPPSFYRPAVPSPLSSPIRASSALPPTALAPRDPNTLPRLRDTQSSPIPAKHAQFKYATRNARPNPVVKRRDDAQEGRRQLFLQNVRQRADDKKWEKRGGENEVLKLEWMRINRELRQAKESDIEGFIREGEIEDEPLPTPQSDEFDVDSMMLDEMEREEEAEINALLSTLPEDAVPSNRSQPDSMHFSDDEDYDELFAELLSSQQSQPTMAYSQDVEMS